MRDYHTRPNQAYNWLEVWHVYPIAGCYAFFDTFQEPTF